MNKKLKWFLIIVVVFIALFILYKMTIGKKDNSEKVTVEKVTRKTIVETVTASGQVYPEVEVKISPDISGEVTELYVKEGDSVQKGKELARIFADLYALQRDEASSQVSQSQATVANSTAALEASKASLDQAKQAYDRNKSLYDQKVISKSELEQFETTFRSAQANYNAAQQNIVALKASVQTAQTGLTRANKDLGRTSLVAPMDGVVSSLKIKKGERVAGNSFNIGTEMMTISDMSVLEVRVDVGENDIVKVNIGDTASIEVDAYSNRKFKGYVTQIASSTKASATSASTSSNDVTNYEVRIRLDKDSYKDLIDPTGKRRFPFRPGMNASADISTRRVDNALAVPVGAVGARVKGSEMSVADKKKEAEANSDPGMQTATNNDDFGALEEVVFIVQPDNTVKKTVVKTGIQDVNSFEILSGLKEGDQVVTGPYTSISKTLKDGMKIKAVAKDQVYVK